MEPRNGIAADSVRYHRLLALGYGRVSVTCDTLRMEGLMGGVRADIPLLILLLVPALAAGTSFRPFTRLHIHKSHP